MSGREYVARWGARPYPEIMRPRSIAIVAVAALFAGSCAETTADMDAPPADGGAGPTAAGPPQSDPVTGESPDREILDFEAMLVGGGTIRGAELAGAPVAVWFWAPW